MNSMKSMGSIHILIILLIAVTEILALFNTFAASVLYSAWLIVV